MASFRIDDILARPHGSRSETGSGLGVPTHVPSYQQLSFGVDQILGRHETEQRERLPLLGKKHKEVTPNSVQQANGTKSPVHNSVLVVSISLMLLAMAITYF